MQVCSHRLVEYHVRVTDGELELINACLLQVICDNSFEVKLDHEITAEIRSMVSGSVSTEGHPRDRWLARIASIKALSWESECKQ